MCQLIAYTVNMHTMQAYYDAMDPDSVSIPLRLRGKRHVVFGNLLDIYTFHDKYVVCVNMPTCIIAPPQSVQPGP